MEYYKYITFPVFGYTINIVYTQDIYSSRLGYVDKLGAITDPIPDRVDGMHEYIESSSEGWIFFTPDSSVGTIAHEAFHAIWRMFRYYGVIMDDETTAYHLGYLVDVLNEFKKDKEITDEEK